MAVTAGSAGSGAGRVRAMTAMSSVRRWVQSPTSEARWRTTPSGPTGAAERRTHGLRPLHCSERPDLHGRDGVRWSSLVLQADGAPGGA